MGYRTTRRQLKRGQSKPANIEWIVTGRVVMVGATCTVHAETREQAISKASMGENIGAIEYDCASLVAFVGTRAEPNEGD